MIHLVILSGRSGSGKSVALAMLEDMGYTCIDNLPAELLLNLIDHAEKTQDNLNLAAGIDIRNPWANWPQIVHTILELRNREIQLQVLFLDASTETLLKRFSETRRKHPLTDSKVDLLQALEQESELLHSMSEAADHRIDTSRTNLYQLRQCISDYVKIGGNSSPFLLFESFGYKYGLPDEADYVFDVRFLPNPYWLPQLRQKTGLDQEVCDYLMTEPEVRVMQRQIEDFVAYWHPHLSTDNRSYLTVAIGCTGGRHRSVFIAQNLYETFVGQYDNVQVRHRNVLNMA